jgi:hypothetical protein
MSTAVLAQSAIAGQVKDATGAVLPGVTVEASSSALIERVRSVATDMQGRFNIVDLRPGSYKVTFSLPGFSMVTRDGIDLPANFTATVNAELAVGAVAETLTVTGAAPVVDVHAAASQQVVSRDLVDAIPTAHDFRGLGATVTGVKVSIQNVGGTRALNPQQLTVHGSDTRDTFVEVDGMILNSMMGDDNIQLYHNDAVVGDITYQTSALTADASKGGVRVSIIPRDGGNTLHGSLYSNYSNSSWQANNRTPELEAKGLLSQNRNGGLYDVDPWIGGPILKNKLWFFGSYRDLYVKEIVANTFYPDGSPGYQQSNTRNATGRMTWQATSGNKISIHYDKMFKHLPHVLNSGDDPLTAGRTREPRDYLAGIVKWTATAGNRLLFETGWATNHETYFSDYQPGVGQVRGTPAWYTQVSRRDSVLGTQKGASAGLTGDYPKNYAIAHSTSYVTGSHNLKTGVQWRFGTYKHTDDANGGLYENFLNGVPDSVDVLNTPTSIVEHWNADLGLYAQDSWTLKRLTVNAGVRFEHFNGQILAQNAPAGRFVPARSFVQVDNLPNWNDVTPRFSLVYDLFGNGKTAIKGSVNKYMQGQALGFARRYNPMALTSDRRTWRDLNGDGVAQDDEIGPANIANLGLTLTRRPDPNISRAYNREYTLGVQHQLLPSVAITAGWYRRRFYNLTNTFNLAVSPADYTAFQAPNPLGTGEMITVYNLNRSKQGLVDQLERNSDINRTIYTGLEANFSVHRDRFSFYGGWTANRNVMVTCDTSDQNLLRFCDQTGQLDQNLGQNASIPFRHDFKLSGYYRLPLDLQFNAAFQSYAGAASTVNWTVPAALFAVVGGRTQVVTVPLVAPGTRFLDRWNQLDLGLRKSFRLQRGVEWSLNLDVFNALNVSPIITELQTFGPLLGRPNEILQGRFPRIGTTIKF